MAIGKSDAFSAITFSAIALVKVYVLGKTPITSFLFSVFTKFDKFIWRIFTPFTIRHWIHFFFNS